MKSNLHFIYDELEMSVCSKSTVEQKIFKQKLLLARSDDWGKLIDIGFSSTKTAEGFVCKLHIIRPCHHARRFSGCSPKPVHDFEA